MPTYEYRCPHGHAFERFYKTISGAAGEVTCPECGAVSMRVMSAGAGLLFKGSGFYLTDYGKNAHRGVPPARAEGGGSETKSDAPKVESSKPDTPKAESPKPKGESPKPAAERPKLAPKKPKSE